MNTRPSCVLSLCACVAACLAPQALCEQTHPVEEQLGAAGPSGHTPWTTWWQGEDRGAFDEALTLAGLSAADFNFSREQVARLGGDKFSLPVFEHYFTNLWDISPFSRRSAKRAIGVAGRPQLIASAAQIATGFRVRDNFYGSYLTSVRERVEEDAERALAEALSDLGAGDPEDIARTDGFHAIPEVVKRAGAVLLLQLAEASRLREVALTEQLERIGRDPQEVFEEAYESVFWTGTLDDPNPPTPSDGSRDAIAWERVLENVDFMTLYRGANTLMLGAEYAYNELRGENARARQAQRLRDQAPRDEDNAVIDQEALDAAIAELELQDISSELATFEYEFTIETNLGWVRFAGAGSHTYGREQDAHDLLVIDTAGDDVYTQAGSTTSYQHGLSVVIDLSGDDLYESRDYGPWHEYSQRVDGRSEEFEYHRAQDHTPSFGAGVCGYGVLIDLAGDDQYRSTFVGQGAGVLGFGMLYDAAGNDRYTGDTALQGAGQYGTGVLADLSGDDAYLCFLRSQGYGGTLGSGLLVDTGGDDDYHAVNSLSEPINGFTVKYSWFNAAKDALNMSQGFGIGRRADMSDGHSWAGGVGTLVDGGDGNDTYQGDIYCQGSAYWYSLGFLYDQGGDDTYTTAAYSLASPPHFAIGVVIDEAGNDVYRGHGSRACGFGRDFSIGWFEEVAGDDRYYCNDSAFGVGNVNGLGLFWDRAGDDVYVARSNSFGQPFVEGDVGSIRDIMINAGLFIDAGGRDTYHMVREEDVEFEDRPFDWGAGEGLAELKLDYQGETTLFHNGSRHSWQSLFEERPGSTGAALDTE